MKFSFLLIAFSMLTVTQGQELYIYSENAKEGFKNSAGSVVIPARYDIVRNFSGELAAVNKGGHRTYTVFGDESLLGGKWGFIDKTGKEVIPLQYEFAESFNSSTNLARVSQNGAYHFIDKKGNRVQPDGIKKYYFANNKLKAEGKEVNGLKTGLWVFYFENGQQKSAENYTAEGKADGQLSYYHPNGKLLGRDIYKNGVFQKPGDYFDNTGKPTLTNGTGYMIYYHTNGAVMVRSNFKNYSRDGETTWFYDNGQVRQKVMYKYSGTDPLGLRWEIVSSFDKYGVARDKGTLKGGNGTWISYDENGKSTSETYQGGKVVISNQQNVTGSNSLKFDKALNFYKQQQYREAYDLFLDAANTDSDPKAMFMVGHMRMNGESVIADNTKAFEWYLKSANLGNADAMAATGSSYFSGLGTKQDYKKAFDWFKKGAAGGHARSMAALGEMYQYGYGTAKDFKQALDWYQKAAEKEDEMAMRYLGEFYYLGTGVTKNFSTALNWFKKAAGKEDAISLRYVGMMYYKGEAVAQDKYEALTWFRKAADKGDDIAMLQIGVMYYQAEAVTRDYSAAMQWYEKAAARDNAVAMRNIGYMFKNGNGVTKNLERSLFWFARSADTDNKNPDALNSLAYAYFELTYYDKAIEVLKKAIKLDPQYANGYDSLGEMYEAKGDRNKAVEQYKKAAYLGHENAKKWLKENGITL